MVRRKQALLVLGALVLILLSLFVYAALRDKTPPQLYVEVPARLPVGAPLSLFVSADEPATFTLTYAGETHTLVEQEATFDVPVALGAQTIELVAEDAAGNSTPYTALVLGVPPVELVVSAPQTVVAGDPVGIDVIVVSGGDPLTSAVVADVELLAAGLPIPLLQSPDTPDGLHAYLASQLSVEPGVINLRAQVVDEFGRLATAEAVVDVAPLSATVEQLRLSSSVLSAVTPEARQVEAEVAARIWAEAEPQPLWVEPFAMPLEGINTSGFGDARRYVEGGPVSFHTGHDFGVPQGTPILASNRGVVVVAGQYAVKGGWVAIDHGGGVMSYYLHLYTIDVQVGQTVELGERIGTVGTTGLSTGPHLHWEIRVRDQPSNPLAWVGKVFP